MAITRPNGRYKDIEHTYSQDKRNTNKGQYQEYTEHIWAAVVGRMYSDKQAMYTSFNC